MEARYRTDYVGEFVILETKWSGGRKSEQREWIPNPIENHHISGRAACIGTDVDKWQFDYTRLQRHRGGLLSSKKLQTYGTGKIAQEMRLDFAVETTAGRLAQLIESEYQNDNIVYTTPRHCVANPGQFYLIPYNVRMVDLAIAVYLAAFDGHKEIFLLGYHDSIDGGHKDWQTQIFNTITAYTGSLFYLVGEKTRMPDSWLECANTRTLTYLEFISYCDV